MKKFFLKIKGALPNTLFLMICAFLISAYTFYHRQMIDYHWQGLLRIFFQLR
ncbi:MAG: hypothetical protein L6416_10920 [Candidatus Omnitrophica bacterium]|nr:hypothetical protein [Candidatus Omnitrophota bacterium]